MNLSMVTECLNRHSRFTGEQFDDKARASAGGLYYLRARYYDPAVGRFLGRDPLPGSDGNPATKNAYVYVGNNPTTRKDPTGTRWATDKEGGYNSYDPEATLDYLCSLGWQYLCVPQIKEGWRLECAIDAESNMVVLCVREARAGDPLFTDIYQGLTSECAQGFAAGVAAGALIGGSVVSGAVIVQSGALVTTSAGALTTSAAGVGAYALGPIPSDTALGIVEHSYKATQGIGECY